MLKLRPYQQEVVDTVLESKSKRQLVVLPTGTGKTVVFCEIAKRMNTRTLVLAHRDELINQAVEKMSWVWSDADIGVVKAERHEDNKQVTVASVQSMNKKRLGSMPQDYDLIITDEAHHATANSYKQIYDYYGLDHPLKMVKFSMKNPIREYRLHIGVTATPNRTDKKLLGDIYDEVTYEKHILDFIPDYLSDLKIVRRESGITIDGVSKSSGDLNCHELSDVLNTKDGNQFVVDTWKEVASDRESTLVFCADISHVHGLISEFQSQDIKALGIWSGQPIDRRRDVLQRFVNGDLQVLINCGILTEGFDCPQIDCILLARPTRSELLMMQMIGRGTRLYPNKQNCLILDIACVSDNWDLVSPAQLFGMQPDKEISTVSVLREYQARQRNQYGSVALSKGVAGIYDTRCPGNLHWQKIRWKGWLLRCGKDGDIRILPDTDNISSIDRYTISFKTPAKDRGEMLLGTDRIISGNLSLDMAFSLAESYVREYDLDIALSLPNRRWHSQPATDAQKQYIRRLGAGDQITPELTKSEASAIITYFKDMGEQNGKNRN